MTSRLGRGYDEGKVRNAFRVSVPSALALGFVMVCWPVWFWGLLGIDLGDAPYPAILYGSVIMGVGLASIGGMRAPRSHLGLLLFLACYKGAAVVFLLGHGLHALLEGRHVPVAVWIIAALWLQQAISNARLYPWGLRE